MKLLIILSFMFQMNTYRTVPPDYRTVNVEYIISDIIVPVHVVFDDGLEFVGNLPAKWYAKHRDLHNITDWPVLVPNSCIYDMCKWKITIRRRSHVGNRLSP